LSYTTLFRSLGPQAFARLCIGRKALQIVTIRNNNKLPRGVAQRLVHSRRLMRAADNGSGYPMRKPGASTRYHNRGAVCQTELQSSVAYAPADRRYSCETRNSSPDKSRVVHPRLNHVRTYGLQQAP